MCKLKPLNAMTFRTPLDFLFLWTPYCLGNVKGEEYLVATVFAIGGFFICINPLHDLQPLNLLKIISMPECAIRQGYINWITDYRNSNRNTSKKT